MHKDLDGLWLRLIVGDARKFAQYLADSNQSLTQARDAWLNAFDKAAEELTRTAALNTLLDIDGPLDGGER